MLMSEHAVVVVVVCLPSAEHRPVLAEAGLLSAELWRPEWLSDAAVSSSESASRGRGSSALVRLTQDLKKTTETSRNDCGLNNKLLSELFCRW